MSDLRNVTAAGVRFSSGRRVLAFRRGLPARSQPGSQGHRPRPAWLVDDATPPHGLEANQLVRKGRAQG